MFGDGARGGLFSLVIDFELILVEEVDELGLEENVLVVHFGAVDLESQFLGFELGRKVKPSHDCYCSHYHDLFLFGLVSLGLVLGHEIKYQQDMSPIDQHVHPILVALELILSDLHVELIPSENLLDWSVELVAR